MLAKPSPSTIANALRSFQVRRFWSNVHATALTLGTSFFQAASVRSYASAYQSAAPSSAYASKPDAQGNYTVSLIPGTPSLAVFPRRDVMLNLVSAFPGDGIGPEISQSVKDIYSAAKVGFSR